MWSKQRIISSISDQKAAIKEEPWSRKERRKRWRKLRSLIPENTWRNICEDFLNVQMNVVKNSLVKIGRHDDSKTISWHASFPVRFARVLAALRLNSPLRGSDSGSLGRQHRKPHDGSLATVRVICFRIHHGCTILRTMFYNAVLFAHCQKLLACPGSLKRKAFSNHRYLLKNFPFP